MNLQTHEWLQLLLPAFHNFSIVSAVCTAGALPVFTPVTTPSIVLLPGKKREKTFMRNTSSETESLCVHIISYYSSLALPHRATPPWVWFFRRFLPLNREFFLSAVTECLLMGLFVGVFSLLYNIKQHNATLFVFLCYINKMKLIRFTNSGWRLSHWLLSAYFADGFI